jgi:hypothetical protein
MAPNGTPHSGIDPEPRSWRQLEWERPLGLFTTALFLLVATTVFHWLLPSHPSWSSVAALAATLLWRFGVHKLGFYSWTFPSRERHSSFSLPQALIEGFAFFIFMLAVFWFSKLELSRFELTLAAIGGLVLGTYSGWYYPTKARS